MQDSYKEIFFIASFLEKTFHFSQESCKHLARYKLIWKVLARNDVSARNLQEILILQETCDILTKIVFPVDLCNFTVYAKAANFN